MTEIYDVNYFINKFEAIPEEKWMTGGYADDYGNCCAYGHCGYRIGRGPQPSEGTALWNLSNESGLYLHRINDGEHFKYQQPTPKQRVLAALRDML